MGRGISGSKAAIIRQQNAFSAFGERALWANDLLEILQEACVLVGEALRADLVKVMELQEDGVTVLMRAGIGWEPGLVGHVRVRADAKSSEGYALRHGEPVISKNIETEARFTYADFIRKSGVKAIANVIISSHNRDRPFGILQVDSRSVRDFNESDVNFLRSYANLLGAAVDRLHVAQATRLMTERLSSVLESTTDSVVMVDRDWRVTYINQRAISLLGVGRVEPGANFWDLYPELDDAPRSGRDHSAFRQMRRVDFEDYLPTLDVWLEVCAYPTSEGLSVFLRDITARRTAQHAAQVTQERTAYLSQHDELTGLPNRTALLARIESAVWSATDHNGLSVHYIDLDGFKAVNDRLGHDAGDTLLQQVATRLHDCIGSDDLAARIGGDEFAVLQSGVVHVNDTTALAQRVLSEVGAPYKTSGHRVVVSPSIGITTIFSPGLGPSDLLKQADLAMYAAKVSGGNTYNVFGKEMQEQIDNKMALRSDLHMLVPEQHLELYYQPILDVRSARIVCLEALLRWHHPERGLIAPGDFIPVAEEAGFIQPIGDWVLMEACREAMLWPATVSVAVNLSPIQIYNPKFLTTVANALQRSGLEAQRLELEITESVLLQDTKANGEVLRKLKQIGVRISMDDFGTGYSSLAYLRSFPLDKMKVDRSFISDLPDKHGVKAIVRAAALLGHSFGLVTTAEGVETEAQLEVLRAEGYDQVQGFLFSRPVSAHEARAMIR